MVHRFGTNLQSCRSIIEIPHQDILSYPNILVVFFFNLTFSASYYALPYNFHITKMKLKSYRFIPFSKNM